MEEKHNSSILRIGFIGAILIMVLLIAGTVWIGRSAGADTREAVRSVSLLYLDELALRREEVVSSALSDYIHDMDVAVGLLESDDLSSVESLQNYQVRIKQLYDLEKFAFVDEDGVIHTARGTELDIDKYDFDYKNISSPEISIKNIDTKNKTVIIAMPVDELPFEGKKLVVCFIEISMDHLLDEVSLKSNNNNTTFCNIYTKDGVALTNMVLGGLASEDNLLDAMDNTDLADSETVIRMRRDFKEGTEGEVSFSYDGINETMYYVPIRDTDWMLTYLIRESVIGEKINHISRSIILRSVIPSVLTAIVLSLMFITIILQTRKNAQITMELTNAPDASAVVGDRERMPEAGSTDYLSKPVGPIPEALFETELLDPEKGIKYCGDPDDYIVALKLFATSAGPKAELITKALEEEDIENYTLGIHSLKSVCNAIGSTVLGEKALALEKASRSGDLSTLQSDTPSFIADYKKLEQILSDALKES